MVRPIDNAPASRAPRLAASITPGPPPVITSKPAQPRASAPARDAAYSSVSETDRAQPISDTALVTPLRSPPRLASPSHTLYPLPLSLCIHSGHPEEQQRYI